MNFSAPTIDLRMESSSQSLFCSIRCLLFTVFDKMQPNDFSSFVYFLTPNRTKVTYRRMFEKLKELRPNLLPLSIMTDFEQATQNAFLDTFPSIELRSCFFHFRQCNYRHIQGIPPVAVFYCIDL